VDVDKMRQFMDKLRPPLVWNFFYDGEEEIPHELRPYCDPRQCYQDGRIEYIINEMESLAYNLRTHEDIVWKKLVDYVVKIFEEQHKKAQEEGGNN
jgi:hypothetical protein